MKTLHTSVSAIALAAATGIASADQVILDDLIVDGSACIGMDCVNGESFGFDTIRIKENNLRIKAQDTSNSASFPTNDWQITFNDSSNGGANKFSIDDIDGGRTPFTIEASAPSHSLYVDDGGRIGLGTATPVVELHVVNGDSPTLRLEQNGSSGFTPQTWDVAGNETNFFVRDATNGSRLPFKIRPSAPTNSLYINTNGDVGIGTSSPTQPLHVRRTDGTAFLLVQDTNSSGASVRELLQLSNNGPVAFSIQNTALTGALWKVETDSSGAFDISKTATGGSEFKIGTDGAVTMGLGGAADFFLDASGNLTVAGTVMGSSDRNMKNSISEVDSSEILEALAELPISTWSYKRDNPSVKHIGPMAQDFHSLFGLGMDEKHISGQDIAGVALSAIKALRESVVDKEARIHELELAQLELMSRLEHLERGN